MGERGRRGEKQGVSRDHDVAWVRVGIKDTLDEDLVRVHLEEPIDQTRAHLQGD